MADFAAGARVLVVDDDEGIAALLKRLLSKEGYEVDIAKSGETALSMMTTYVPDVVMLDVVLPDVDGFALCKRLKSEAATRLTPVVMITGLSDRETRIEGAEVGADEFLTKPVDPRELLARIRSLVRLKRYTDDLDSAASIIMALAVMIETRGGRTEGHCHRVANRAVAVGRRMALADDDLQALYRGGFLHDIGMLAIPDGMLSKAARLEPAEFEIVKSHTVVGDQLCANLRSLQAVRPIIRSHHERLDGSGYPDGLRGDDIPILAQIIGAVDLHDAATSYRPYQRPLLSSEALEVLWRQVEKGWRRADVVEHFAAVLHGGDPQSIIS
jgi:putative two-component system response regulator